MKTTRPTITYLENGKLITKKLYFWNKAKIINKIFSNQEDNSTSNNVLLKEFIINKIFCPEQEVIYTSSKYHYIKLKNYNFKEKVTFRCNPNNSYLILENCTFKSLNLDGGDKIEVINHYHPQNFKNKITIFGVRINDLKIQVKDPQSIIYSLWNVKNIQIIGNQKLNGQIHIKGGNSLKFDNLSSNIDLYLPEVDNQIINQNKAPIKNISTTSTGIYSPKKASSFNNMSNHIKRKILIRKKPILTRKGSVI